MPVEKGKVKAALDIAFKGKSVSKELKEAYAARWADRIEDEAGIEEFINDRKEDVLDAAKEADRRSQAAAAKARQDAADAAAGKKPEDQKPEDVDDPTEPAWAKKLRQQNEALQARLDGFQQQQSAKTIEQQFKSDPRIKGVHESFLKGRIPSSADDFESAIEETVNDWKSVAEAHKFTPFGNETPPGGQAAPKPGDGKVDPAIIAYAAKKNAEAKQSQNN